MSGEAPARTSSGIPPIIANDAGIGWLFRNISISGSTVLGCGSYIIIPALWTSGALAGEERVAADQDCARMQLDQGSEGGVDFAFAQPAAQTLSASGR